MKLGVFAVLFGDQPLDKALDYIAECGCEMVELGTGNYPGNAHVPLHKLVSSVHDRTEFLAMVRSKGLDISALSCHGNPLHPQKKIAKSHHDVWRDTVKLAKLLEIDTVVNFSGCPGSNDRDRFPNWVTCPWPDDFSAIVKWQWEKKVIPYWKAEAKYARDNGVNVAFEMHPGFCVYNTETLLRLREATGKNVGANFDPSHLFWQGMDPLACLRALGGDAVFHVHAKDCAIDPLNVATVGVLDTKHYGDEINRSWIFRTVGYGHDEKWWKDFVSTLRLIGYDGALSIEHEDSLMSVNEGFKKAVELLKRVLLTEQVGGMWWA